MVASIKPHRDEVGLGDGQLLIDGEWSPARDGQTWSHYHPATGEEVASFPIAGPHDVDLAVRAARRAFDEGPWPRARASERIRVLRRIADLVRAHGDGIPDIIPMGGLVLFGSGNGTFRPGPQED